MSIDYEGPSFNSNSLTILQRRGQRYGNTQNHALASATASLVRGCWGDCGPGFGDLV